MPQWGYSKALAITAFSRYFYATSLGTSAYSFVVTSYSMPLSAVRGVSVIMFSSVTTVVYYYSSSREYLPSGRVTDFTFLGGLTSTLGFSAATFVGSTGNVSTSGVGLVPCLLLFVMASYSVDASGVVWCRVRCSWLCVFV